MVQEIEDRLATIEKRNHSVALDKAWERSFTRRGAISAITYLVACALMLVLEVPQWYFSALIPVCGYILSTLSLPVLKKRWIDHQL